MEMEHIIMYQQEHTTMTLMLHQQDIIQMQKIFIVED